MAASTSPVFQKSERTPFYWHTAPPSLPSGDYSIAFLMPTTLSSASTVDMLSGWQAGGVYLFLNASQTSVEQIPTFVPTVMRLLNDPDFQNLRFLWLENPADAFSAWRFQYLAVEPEKVGQPAIVRQPTVMRWRNYGLAIARGTQVTVNSTNDGFTLTRDPQNSTGLALVNTSTNAALTGIQSPIQLSLAGNKVGCWRVDLTLRRGAAKMPYQELAALDVGLRICCKDPAFFDPEQPQNSEFIVTHQHYPFLSEDPADVGYYPHDLILYAQLDPLYPLNEGRTYFGFVNAQGQTTAAMPSCFHTHLGHQVHLTPHNALSRLVFTVLPSSSQPSPDDPFYLVPQGEFEITVPPHTDYTPPDIDQNFLCGLSGVEYVKLPKGQTNLLCFRTGYPAFAPSFIPGIGLDTTVSGEPLTDFATTAWAFVRQADAALTYYAQPDQAVLHSLEARPADPQSVATAIATAPQSASAPDLLWYMEVPAAELPVAELPTDDQALPTVEAFPMLPYGGVARHALEDYQRLEQQLVSPHRRAVITAAIAKNPPPPAPVRLSLIAGLTEPSITGTTPQGFLAEFSPDYAVMQSLLLARDTADQKMQFHTLAQTDPLRASLQSNQLFLVITNPESLRNHFGTDNQLTIQDWQFDLDPAVWKQHGTILIFKFYDRPATELVQSLSTWSQPQIFSTDKSEAAIAPDLDALSQRLSTFFQQDIIARGKSDVPKDRENYGQLAQALQSPTWSGVIAFNVSVPPENFPDELKALAAGIDGDRFMAQYVGIETTPVVPEGGKLVAKPSSLFGLIDYQADVKPVSPVLDYDFQVQTLRVLFQNSQIKAFSSDVSITLNALFGDRTQLFNPNAIGNTVLLKGTAENHNGKTTYAFSFVGDNIFALPGSPILNTIKIIKAQFATDPIVTDADGAQKITGRFTFWGQLNFRKLEKFDIFSFGPEEPPDAKGSSGLSFANLVITMAFQKNPVPADPQAPANAPPGTSPSPHRNLNSIPATWSSTSNAAQSAPIACTANSPSNSRNLSPPTTAKPPAAWAISPSSRPWAMSPWAIFGTDWRLNWNWAI